MSNELKKAIKNAKTEEQKKAVMEKYEKELKQLSDDEIYGVVGGAYSGALDKQNDFVEELTL